VAAALVLTAILACSGLGLCWREFTSGHDCCVDDSTLSAPAKACASDATAVAVTLMPPPAGAVSVVPDRPSLATAATALPASASCFALTAPPLILRI
jgi:hypothetical protein